MEKSPNYETKNNDYHETRINNDSNQVGNKEKAGNLLDNNHHLAAMDKYDIIGAACDVKPVAEFRIDIPIIQQKDVCNEIEDILENLELKHTQYQKPIQKVLKTLNTFIYNTLSQSPKKICSSLKPYLLEKLTQ